MTIDDAKKQSVTDGRSDGPTDERVVELRARD